MMIIEHLEDYYRKQGEDRKPPNPWRASAMGHCIRAGCYEELGLKGKPIQPRRLAVFKHGIMIHDCLTEDLKAALGWRFVSEKELLHGKNYVEIDGARISFHIDGAFQYRDGKDDNLNSNLSTAGRPDYIGIVEFKSMSDFGFNRALKGEVDREYLAQAWCYFVGTDFNPVVFVAYRKETSAMVEVVFDRNCNEKIISQRLTGDPIELAKVDPILLTEIRTPFDESVEDYVRERIAWLKATKELTVDKVRDFVPGADAVVDEVVSVQGMKAAQELMLSLGKDLDLIPERSGSWYKINTGRKILGFPCSYCSYMDQCYKTEMEMKGDKPVFVVK